MSTDLQSILDRSDVPEDVKATIGRHLEREAGPDQNQALFRALGAFLRAGLLVEDEEGRIIYINERLSQLTGLTAQKITGRPLDALLADDAVGSGDSPTTKAPPGKPQETALVGGDGITIPVTLVPFPLFDPDGRYYGRFIVVTERTISALGAPPRAHAHAPSPAVDNNRLALLSPREREILNELLAGRRVNDVASRLDISRHTVRNHLKAIYRKLGVHSQVELIGRFWPTNASDGDDQS